MSKFLPLGRNERYEACNDEGYVCEWQCVDGSALKDLRKAGLITTEQRYREKGGKSSLLYKIQTR